MYQQETTQVQQRSAHDNHAHQQPCKMLGYIRSHAPHEATWHTYWSIARTHISRSTTSNHVKHTLATRLYPLTRQLLRMPLLLLYRYVKPTHTGSRWCPTTAVAVQDCPALTTVPTSASLKHDMHRQTCSDCHAKSRTTHTKGTPLPPQQNVSRMVTHSLPSTLDRTHKCKACKDKHMRKCAEYQGTTLTGDKCKHLANMDASRKPSN
jgi:hypothetical protein